MWHNAASGERPLKLKQNMPGERRSSDRVERQSPNAPIMSRFFENKFVQRILHINDTPEAIALGASVGMFLGMTPTVGLQMIIMLIVGTVIRANRIAGVAMVYISNPLTVVPIYWLDYLVGSTLLDSRSLTYDGFRETCRAFMSEWDVAGLWTATLGFISVHSDIAVAMAVGGVVLGVVFALPVYPLTLRLVLAHRRHKAKKSAKAADAAADDSTSVGGS